MLVGVEDVTLDVVPNPFLDAIRRHSEFFNPERQPASARARHRLQQLKDALCYRYSYALPSPELLGVLAANAPLVEMGAGRGYWASLLKAGGVDIIAYDECPAAQGEAIVDNQYLSSAHAYAYTDILPGEPKDLIRHPDRALFLCWPPINNMAEDCLKWFQGDTLIYLGTGSQGMDAPDRFFEKLVRRWTPEASFPVEPSAWDVDEKMIVYRRQ